jgi:hypothetical protein
MSPDYGSEQFVFSNVIRAFGQPFTIVPLSALATALLQPKTLETVPLGSPCNLPQNFA